MNLSPMLRGLSYPDQDANFTKIMSSVSEWNNTEGDAYHLVDLPPITPSAEALSPHSQNIFPTADVPDHAHYAIGATILVVGFTGVLGNLLVIYTFCRSRSLRTPANMFIINLAISDFFMSFTQAPVFFANSLYKRWIFGEKGCEFYAFCGALFGITSMITLMVIALDRYFVITRPLASIGMISKKKTALILLGVWLYSLTWSLPPFFGWSAYVPEGLLTSCSWDYTTFTPSVRAYTMLLFCFVFFIPLIIIIYCYIFIFRAIQDTNKAVQNIGDSESTASPRHCQKLKNEWKMAKIALVVILLYVLSWAPYSIVALVAFAGYSHILTPYMNSVPAIIAKASAIHNPIIYAISHPKYRMAIAQNFPCLRALLCIKHPRTRSFSSYRFTHRSTVTSQASDISWQSQGRRQLSLGSESEVGWSNTKVGVASLTLRNQEESCRMDQESMETGELMATAKAKGESWETLAKTLEEIDDLALLEALGFMLLVKNSIGVKTEVGEPSVNSNSSSMAPGKGWDYGEGPSCPAGLLPTVLLKTLRPLKVYIEKLSGGSGTLGSLEEIFKA
ncbi:melanopsin [Macrotis lagotis]|uniref:melanopsin n=1 Tax=Macrotis lagotis TaxID=92651 RepID=UPI003D68BF71